MRGHDEGALATAVADGYRTAVKSISALGEAASSLSVLPGPATRRAVLDTELQLREVEEEFGLLDAAEMGQRAGSGAVSQRAWASARHRAGELIAIRRGQRLRYPSFQLDADGRVRPVIAAIVTVLGEAGWSERSMLLWLVASNGWLEGARPVDLLDSDGERVVQAARHRADRW